MTDVSCARMCDRPPLFLAANFLAMSPGDTFGQTKKKGEDRAEKLVACVSAKQKLKNATSVIYIAEICLVSTNWKTFLPLSSPHPPYPPLPSSPLLPPPPFPPVFLLSSLCTYVCISLVPLGCIPLGQWACMLYTGWVQCFSVCRVEQIQIVFNPVEK